MTKVRKAKISLNETSSLSKMQENAGKLWIAVVLCKIEKNRAPDQYSERILSMDWFKKSFLDVRSALGNLAAIPSRAVLEDTAIRRWLGTSWDNGLLFSDRHQVLSAKVVPKCAEEFFVGWIRVIARPSEHINWCGHRKCGRRSCCNTSTHPDWSCPYLRPTRADTTEHAHSSHHSGLRGQHRRHAIDTSCVVVWKRGHHMHHMTVVRSRYRTGKSHSRKLRNTKGHTGLTHTAMEWNIAMRQLTASCTEVRAGTVAMQQICVPVVVSSLVVGMRRGRSWPRMRSRSGLTIVSRIVWVSGASLPSFGFVLWL